MAFSLFGPLDKSYCDIFTVLGFILIISFVFTFFTLLYFLLFVNTMKSKMGFFVLMLFYTIFAATQFVFVGLLYRMCKNAKRK